MEGTGHVEAAVDEAGVLRCSCGNITINGRELTADVPYPIVCAARDINLESMHKVSIAPIYTGALARAASDPRTVTFQKEDENSVQTYELTCEKCRNSFLLEVTSQTTLNASPTTFGPSPRRKSLSTQPRLRRFFGINQGLMFSPVIIPLSSPEQPPIMALEETSEADIEIEDDMMFSSMSDCVVGSYSNQWIYNM